MSEFPPSQGGLGWVLSLLLYKVHTTLDELAQCLTLEHAVTLEGDVEAYEVKRQRKKYSPTLLESKVAEMQKHLFKGKVIQTACLSLEDM